MTLPDDWWTTGLDDEPCDGCGVKPSKHAGHGSYTCQKCYDARWCQSCTYSVRGDLVDGVHVCPSTDERAKREREARRAMVLIDCDAEKYLDEYDAEIAALRARLATAESTIAELRAALLDAGNQLQAAVDREAKLFAKAHEDDRGS